MKKLGILFSGGGSTMAEVIRQCTYGLLKGWAIPVVTICSDRNAGGRDGSKTLGTPGELCERRQYPSYEAWSDALLGILQKHEVELVMQLGWTERTPRMVIEAYQGLIGNQHCGGLDHGKPGFGGEGMVGLAVHEAVLQYLRETDAPKHGWWTEMVCHRVTEKWDDGEVIWLARVPVDLEHDTAESLQTKALPVEWAVQVAAIQQLAAGTARPIERTDPVIKPGTESILAECKRKAIDKYPFKNPR